MSTATVNGRLYLSEVTTPRETFAWCLENDLWPVAVYPKDLVYKEAKKSGKEPIFKEWGLSRWTIDKWEEARRWVSRIATDAGDNNGSGVCLGPGRGPGGRWLIDVEGDGPEAEQSRGVLFGGDVVETVSWGSVRGGHQLLVIDPERLLKILPALSGYEKKDATQPGVYCIDALPGLELRFGGFKSDGSTVKQLQSVLPPTPGTDGTPRRFTGSESVADAPESFYVVLDKIAAAAKSEQNSGPPVPGDYDDNFQPRTSHPFNATVTNRAAAWLKKAFESACGRVANAAEGHRHPTLRSETRALAGYLHYGLGYTEAELRAGMIRAADAATPKEPGRIADHPRCVDEFIKDGKASSLRLKDELHKIAVESNGGPAPQYSTNGDGYGDSWEGEPAKENPKAAAFGFRWEPVPSFDFFTRDYRPAWDVKNAIARGMPAVIGGPQKLLKTSFAVDLSVSLASGTSWLGTFPCARRRVALLSGESGPFTLQETARRVCRARGIEPVSLGDFLRWQFRLPQLAALDQLDALQAGMERDRIEVVIIDPLYLSLLSGADGAKAENLFDTGPLLLRVAQACESVGATLILLHHTTKPTSRKLEPLDLSDLAFSGIAEFSRQWVLLSRREPYGHDGKHALWMVVGGSVGHGGLYAVDVDEGQLAEDFTGRKWDVSVKPGAEAREAERTEKTDAKAEERRRRDQSDETGLLAALNQLARNGEAVPYGRVRDLAGLTKDRMSGAFERLIASRTVTRATVKVKIANGAERDWFGFLWVAVGGVNARFFLTWGTWARTHVPAACPHVREHHAAEPPPS